MNWTVSVATVALLLCVVRTAASQENAADYSNRLKQAVSRSIPLLEATSAKTADKRDCFTCHGQAMPVLALVKAQGLGLNIDSDNLQRQLDHTHRHLRRSTKRYESGKGTGGQVDTAGWALWALEAGHRNPDQATQAVVRYLLSKQEKAGVWKCSSKRPPSEASHFATSYLALRGLEFFGDDQHADRIDEAIGQAGKWHENAVPSDTEDRVFQLLALPYVGASEQSPLLSAELLNQQKHDGGWAQRDGMESDAYATATVLYALAQSGTDARHDGFRRGLEYLLNHQNEDGSWHVATRSKPIQKYFESGFPHGKDQFISTTATCWATIVLIDALGESSAE